MATGQEFLFNNLIKFMGVTPEQAKSGLADVAGKVNTFDARLTEASNFLREAVKQLTEINAKLSHLTGETENGEKSIPRSERNENGHGSGGRNHKAAERNDNADAG